MDRRTRLALGAGAAGLLAIVWVSSAAPVTVWRKIDLGSSESRPRPTPPPSLAPAETLPPFEPGEPADLGWLANSLLVLLAVALVAAIVWWLSRREWVRPTRPGRIVAPMPEIAPEELLDAADELDLLISRGSARNAIVACWVRLEQAVEDAGLRRNPAETASEMTARVLRAYAVDAGPIGALAGLYREARFSSHDMGEEHRREAQQALGAIRAQLHAAAEVARDRTSAGADA